MANNWPTCIKEDVGIEGNNQNIVFVANPAYASDANVNSTNQKCELSSNQLLYLTVYPGECSPFELNRTASNTDLLNCAVDSNKIIKLMKVKVDGEDVSSSIIRQQTSKPFNFIIPLLNVDNAKPTIVGKNNPSMAENYYLFFKAMPVGNHRIDLEVIRQPQQAALPVERHIANWDIKVVP